jgi:hypothetical protein
MKLAQSVKLGAWLLISLNLLMAFGSIWVFVRMAPAIDVIIVRNEVSLQACQDMLAALATDAGSEASTANQIGVFRQALARAANNVTETEEPGIVQQISASYESAFAGNSNGRTRTIEAILELGAINRNAMRKADRRAQQLGYAGAWGIVFMATTIFLVGMVFQRRLKSNLADPLQEIDAAVDAFRNGDIMRRCSLNRPSNNIRQVLDHVNELLDACTVGQAAPGVADRRD